MFKQKYKYKCVRCGANKTTVDKTRNTCQPCMSCTKPGIGQTNIYGEIITK